MHCLDHLDRLIDRCQQADRARTVAATPDLAVLAAALHDALAETRRTLQRDDAAVDASALLAMRDRIRHERRPYRARTVESLGPGVDIDAVIARLDAVRWLHRTAYHAWRIVHHLAILEAPHAAPPGPDEIAARSEADPAEIDA